uniref:Uncharacterized protein n=1 Tax=Anopheles atroparvus TaxID=41427 RepID=A0AAG5DWA3_ANOAO
PNVFWRVLVVVIRPINSHRKVVLAFIFPVFLCPQQNERHLQHVHNVVVAIFLRSNAHFHPAVTSAGEILVRVAHLQPYGTPEVA